MFPRFAFETPTVAVFPLAVFGGPVALLLPPPQPAAAGDSNDDRYRGLKGLRTVVFMNEAEMNDRGPSEFDLVDITTYSKDVDVAAAMAIAFIVISTLGIVVFFKAGDWPVGLVFVGL